MPPLGRSDTQVEELSKNKLVNRHHAVHHLASMSAERELQNLCATYGMAVASRLESLVLQTVQDEAKGLQEESIVDIQATRCN